MPAKRKSDTMEPTNFGSTDTLEHPLKKARVDSKPKSWHDIQLDGEDTVRISKQSHSVHRLIHEPDFRIASPFSMHIFLWSSFPLTRFIYSDDCAEIRRKIRLLQKTPGWKVCILIIFRLCTLATGLGHAVVARNWRHQQQFLQSLQ